MSTPPLGALAPQVGDVPGPRSRELSARLAAVESPAFEARREAREARSGEEQGAIVYAEAHGDNVRDVDGNVFVDLTAGFGALALGHTPEVLSAALSRELGRLPLALGDVYAAESKVLACERIAQLFPEPGARVMLGSSGADAVTAALKTVELHGRAGLVAFRGAYHGLSHGPLAACGLSPAFREPFAGSLSKNVQFAPFPESAAELDGALGEVRRLLASGAIGGVLVEPLLGRGGCVEPPAAFLRSCVGYATKPGRSWWSTRSGRGSAAPAPGWPVHRWFPTCSVWERPWAAGSRFPRAWGGERSWPRGARMAARSFTRPRTSVRRSPPWPRSPPSSRSSNVSCRRAHCAWVRC